MTAFKRKNRALRAGLIEAVILLIAALAFGCKMESTNNEAGAHSARHNSHSASATTAQAKAVGGDAPHINNAPPPGPAPEGMVWVPGGTFWMGCDDCEMPDAAPVHLVTVDGFWMDATPITNAQFAKFVEATNYKTVAERQPDPKDFPGVPAEKLVPGSAVFTPPLTQVSLNNVLNLSFAKTS
jgi:formylglycine-generating enzyme